MERERAKGLLLRARGLALLRAVLEGAPARDLLSILRLASEGGRDSEEAVDACGRLWGTLVHEAREERLLDDAWCSYLVRGLLDDENPWSLAAERGDEVASALREQVARELRVLQELSGVRAAELFEILAAAVPETAGLWSGWGLGEASGQGPRRDLAEKLAATEDWGACVEDLERHFAGQGAGIFGRFRTLRWREGRLEPVRDPDPVRLSELGGHEEEREPLLRNTERFLAGLPASHALVYGQPGTGKSSNVKAVLGSYAEHGLRAVEVAREDLVELPGVLEALRGRGVRCVVFVDDLSFEEQETGYKALKALLEGSLEAPPGNVLLYATSNRRNLVRESFTERDEDVHAQDTAREKLSLAARFGLRVTFLAPDQKKYLAMVENLARMRGLQLPKEDLHERALSWERKISARSGRTARQFVDELQATIAEEDGGPGTGRALE